MHDFLVKKIKLTAIDDLNIDSGAATYEFVAPEPVNVLRVGFLITTAVVKTGGAKVTLSARPTVGSASGAVTKDTFTVAAGAAGTGSYRDTVDAVAEASVTGAAGHTDKVNVGPAGIKIDAGGSLLFTVSTAADSGAGQLWVEYVALPFAGTRIANYTKDTA